ncbi:MULTISPECIES: GntR family transcriptional regulator [unclassified Mesorhizobium]|uniref:GntR family transcriptional regulator n=1 Tax=unclassified Mesorhizobium TaxID=325217 RepID=UPI000FD3F0A0|nr:MULTISPECIES: GntR family transcriptional regulator [unclassified Mesorhizobium]RUU94419.1 GntR family transcriptional regulator [Mesorhizobium sp. M1A.F.Ca.IN.020.03.2.1]RWG87112.1 MAG: GntR family transcriptional regulator [Mesorhizobium sp.]RWK18250.1 MAG: GntR family transcriptional regulator [Mesorhizobium sp.]
MNGSITVTLHEKVRQEIMRRVTENDYKVGEPLPSVAALAEEFGVSAITIKRALRDLQPTGILRSVLGLGIFVRERRRFIRDLNFCVTSTGDSLRFGQRPSIQLTSVTRERIRNPAFSEFDAPTGKMLCIRRIISAEETPIMFDTSYLPLSLNDKVVDEFGEKFVSDALRDQGRRFRKTKLLVDAAPASEEAQQAFGIPNGYPTLRRLYHLTTADPSFSVFGIAESPFDRLACSVELEHVE